MDFFVKKPDYNKNAKIRTPLFNRPNGKLFAPFYAFFDIFLTFFCGLFCHLESRGQCLKVKKAGIFYVIFERVGGLDQQEKLAENLCTKLNNLLKI